MQRDDLNKFYESSISYLNSDMREEERSEFINSLNQNDKLKALFFQLKDVWEYHQLKDKSQKINLDDVWDEMMDKHIHPASSTKSLFGQKWTSRVWQIAAMVIALLGIGWLLAILNPGEKTNTDLAHVIECSKGDMVKLSLSDGTFVWINSASKLTLNEDFSSENRQLSLTGEAYFDVKSDSLNPFKIDVAGYQVSVKGTSFNLRHYPEENLFQTSLEEGVVQINKGDQLLTLNQGDQLNINTVTGQQKLLRNQDLYQFSAWRTGRLEFENISMEELTRHIERWYNHTIIIKDKELLKLKFSGVLKHNKSIDHIMRVLSITHPISYDIQEDTIFIEQMNTRGPSNN